jgi:hypothetical protein
MSRATRLRVEIAPLSNGRFTWRLVAKRGYGYVVESGTAYREPAGAEAGARRFLKRYCALDAPIELWPRVGGGH